VNFFLTFHPKNQEMPDIKKSNMFCTGIFLKIKDGEGWDGWGGVDLTRATVTAFDQWVSREKNYQIQ
jgi:hypothetical protein